MTECDNSMCMAEAKMPVLDDGGERMGFACCNGCRMVIGGKQTQLQ